MPEVSLSDAAERIRELMDDGKLLHSVIRTGGHEDAEFFIAVIEGKHDGRRYLNERYVALAKSDARDRTDTFMTNGINRRMDTNPDQEGAPTPLANKLAQTYARIDALQRYPNDAAADAGGSETLHLDATERDQ